eukprot:15471901-Alexandrium_andersonii.AAC.1
MRLRAPGWGTNPPLLAAPLYGCCCTSGAGRVIEDQAAPGWGANGKEETPSRPVQKPELPDLQSSSPSRCAAEHLRH